MTQKGISIASVRNSDEPNLRTSENSESEHDENADVTSRVSENEILENTQFSHQLSPHDENDDIESTRSQNPRNIEPIETEDGQDYQGDLSEILEPQQTRK